MSARQFEENALYVEVFSSFVSQWFWVLAIFKNILAVQTVCCAFGNFMGRFETPKKILCGEKREREREREAERSLGNLYMHIDCKTKPGREKTSSLVGNLQRQNQASLF